MICNLARNVDDLAGADTFVTCALIALGLFVGGSLVNNRQVRAAVYVGALLVLAFGVWDFLR